MASSEFIEYAADQESHIATITFKRPEKLNAFTLEMYEAVAAGIAEVNNDDAIKVVILKGDGSAFTAGHDLGEVGFMYGMGTDSAGKNRRPSQRRRLAIDRRWGSNLAAVAYCQKITIVQVQGYCYGSGFDYFLSADLSVLAEDAVLGNPGRRLVGPGLGFNTFLWMWRLGPTLAKHLAITGDTVSGQEAKELGLTRMCVPEGQLGEETMELARKAARLSADGIVMGKAAFQVAADALGLGLGYSSGYIMHTLATNVRFDEDEYNYFRERRDRGVRQAFHDRDAFFEAPTEDAATG